MLGALPELLAQQSPSGEPPMHTLIDGFVHGLLTAGVFGWLWPRCTSSAAESATGALAFEIASPIAGTSLSLVSVA